MAEKSSKGLGAKVTYNAVSADTYRGFGFPGADDLGNMFQIYDEFEGPFSAVRSVDVTRSLAPSLMSFDQWLAKNKAKVVAAGSPLPPLVIRRGSAVNGSVAQGLQPRCSSRARCAADVWHTSMNLSLPTALRLRW